MARLFDLLLGPLALPECRRSVARGWIILFRTLAALAAAGALIVVCWFWWSIATRINPNFMPFAALRIALVVVLGMMVVGVLILTPALMAGSLAGDRDRQAMGLLLTTRVNSLEIVLGRMAGKYSQIASILLATLPVLLFLSWLAGLQPAAIATAVLYPPLIALGVAGLTAGASSVSRRGRDALLGTYLLGLGLVAFSQSSTFLPASLAPLGNALALVEPVQPVSGLVNSQEIAPPWKTAAIWLSIGLFGSLLAVWRLRPNCLKWLGGEAPKRKRQRRWLRVPPVADRPMLWKETYIERGRSIAGFAKWLGLLASLYLIVATIFLAGRLTYALLVEKDPNTISRWTDALSDAVGSNAALFAVIVVLAVALRASVAIASERERNTWDGLLTSPMEGGEIVRGKLWGSLLGLRFLLVAVFFSWGVAFGFGAMPGWSFLSLGLSTVAWSAYGAALGVRMSLTSATATSAMAKTIGATFGTWIGLRIAAWVLVGLLAFFYMVAWYGLLETGLISTAFTSFPVDGFVLAFVFEILMVVSATSAMASETALRFDRLAGRMASGGAGLALDRALHGGQLEPVLLDGPAEKDSAA